MTPTNDWITDRRPTEADAGSNGDVIILSNPSSGLSFFMHWRYVGKFMPWKHCAVCLTPAAPEPAATPRKFASITRTVTDIVNFAITIDAIDDDGVAWWMTIEDDDSEPKWHQLTPLPGREVVG